jgi:hypothetical protein
MTSSLPPIKAFERRALRPHKSEAYDLSQIVIMNHFDGEDSRTAGGRHVQRPVSAGHNVACVSCACAFPCEFELPILQVLVLVLAIVANLIIL